MRRVLASLLAVGLGLGLAACAHLRDAAAADQTRRGKIAAPQQPPAVPYTPPVEDAYKQHNWYVGGAGGYAWAPEGFDDVWHGGILGGYLWRPNERIGVGVEADYMLRDLGDIALDDSVFSVRARLGLFMTPATFVYGTAGISHATEAFIPDGFRRGPVVGGGIEYDVAGTPASVRAELLHYRHADEYLDWGDEGSTAVRLGLALKF